MYTLPPAQAKVMASSERGNKQLQPLLFHWRSFCTQGEPSALRFNQYKSCALPPRTLVFRHPVILRCFTRWGTSTNKYTYPGSPLSDHWLSQWQNGWFPPLWQSIKISISKLQLVTGEGRGGYNRSGVVGGGLIKGAAHWASSAVIQALDVAKINLFQDVVIVVMFV